MKKLFNYCPNCSSENVDFQENKKFLCKDCSYTYFHNTSGSTVVLLRNKNKLLCIQRNQEPQKGKLDLPGGFIDPFESAEEGAVREVKEELFLDLEPHKLKFIASFPNQYTYKNVLYNTVDLFFEYEIEKVNIIDFNTCEIQKTVWLSLENIILEDLAFESQKRFFRKYKRKLLW